MLIKIGAEHAGETIEFVAFNDPDYLANLLRGRVRGPLLSYKQHAARVVAAFDKEQLRVLCMAGCGGRAQLGLISNDLTRIKWLCDSCTRSHVDEPGLQPVRTYGDVLDVIGPGRPNALRRVMRRFAMAKGLVDPRDEDQVSTFFAAVVEDRDRSTPAAAAPCEAPQRPGTPARWRRSRTQRKVGCPKPLQRPRGWRSTR